MDADDKVLYGGDVDFELSELSVPEMLFEKMKSLPEDKVIQVNAETGEARTAGEQLSLSLQIAEGLLALGLCQGDVVALLGVNSYRLHAAALGIIWTGGVFAPLDPQLKVFELQNVFKFYQPRIVFCQGSALVEVEKALHLLKNDAKIILLDDAPVSSDKAVALEAMLRPKEVAAYQPIQVPNIKEDLAMIICSSGSTGMPKGVGLTHFNITYLMLQMQFNLKEMMTTDYMQTSHFFWASGTSAFFMSCGFGVNTIFLESVNELNILRAIDKYKPVWGMFPPAELKAMMAHADFKKFDVSSIKFAIAVGSALPKSVAENFKKEWPSDTVIAQCYGTSELTAGGTTVEPFGDISSVGKPGKGLHMKVIDTETGAALGPNETGELCFKSPSIMKGYVGNEEATREAVDKDGWLHTGDLGYYKENMAIYLVDRLKELIKYRNQQISPTEVESLIITLPGVIEVGVVGVPHETDCYHPMALVVKEANSSITAQDIIHFVKDNMSSYKQLRGGVYFVQSIPRTPSKKIKRSLLKEMAKSLYAQQQS